MPTSLLSRRFWVSRACSRKPRFFCFNALFASRHRRRSGQGVGVHSTATFAPPSGGANSLLDRRLLGPTAALVFPLPYVRQKIMSGDSSQAAKREKERVFWAEFAQLVREEGFEGQAPSWIVRRAEAFVGGLDGRKLREVSPTYVERHFRDLGRDAALEGWQLEQVVEALRILFLVRLRAEWAGAFDWDGWKAQVHDINPDHPTLAREDPAPPEDGRPHRDTAGGGALPAGAEEALRKVRDLTRTRNLSIRTEQTYLDWARRFFRFCGEMPEDPAHAVVAYLEFLALKRPERPAEGGQGGGRAGRAHQAGFVSHPEAFLRHAPARSRLRHPYRSGTARARECVHHHDLHARAQPAGGQRPKPGRHVCGVTCAEG